MTSGSREIAVELRHVTKAYPNVVALRDVSLAVRKGEFFALLGPSGCGKTTTLNLIGGFIEPDEGDILIRENSVVHVPPHKRPVNTVFQSYALFPHMNIAENIAFGLKMKRVPPPEVGRRVKEIMALVSLPGLEARRPSQLSGGQQQRVALARALVNQPAVLLLDEPLGALDLKLRKQMQLELSRIQREVGVTFIYVTHDQEEAMTMSDRIAVMDQGQVVQVGTSREIYDRPANKFVADFIGSSNVLPGHIVGKESGMLTVQLNHGALIKVPLAPGLGENTDVSVVVRPDWMEVRLAPPADSMNSVRGSVTKISYLGTHFQIAVRVGTALELAVHQPGPVQEDNGRLPGVGEDAYVAWSPMQSLCFRE